MDLRTEWMEDCNGQFNMNMYADVVISNETETFASIM